LEINLEKKEKSYGLLTLKVSEDDYTPEYNKRVKEYSKRANLKGFRPGKVPQGLIKKMMGKGIKQEIFNEVVSQNVDSYFSDNDVDYLFYPSLIGEPVTVEDLEVNQDTELNFEVLLQPEIEYDLSEEVKLSQYKLVPSEEDINKAIERFQENFPKVSNPEEIGEGDFIKGDFKSLEEFALDDEHAPEIFEMETVLPLNKIVEAQRGEFVGKKVGETIQFDLNTCMPDSNDVKLLFGVEAEQAERFTGIFELSVTEISRNEKPDLDQEFFDKLFGPGEVTTEEEFKDKVKENLALGYEQSVQYFWSDEVKKYLTEKIAFELDESIMEKIFRRNSGEDLTPEAIEKDMPRFTEAIKWQAIINKIAKEGELQINEEDIRNEAARQVYNMMGAYAQQLGGEFIEQMVDNYLQMENGANRTKAVSEIQARFVSDFVQSKVTVEYKEVDEAEFGKIIEEENKKHAPAEETNPEELLAESATEGEESPAEETPTEGDKE